jgi:selenocysteine lyase/cysteine desulfurase
VHFCVDAIQGLGVLPLDLARLPIDFLATGAHKWLLGPQGAAALYIRRELLDRLHPVGVGAHSVRDPFNYDRINFDLKPHAGRYEGGTMNYGGFSAWGASLSLLEEIGPTVIEARVKSLSDHLCERARSAGIDVFSSRAANEWSGIVSMVVPDLAGLVKKCRAAGFVVTARGGRLRACPHVYNTEDELNRLMEAVCH